MKIKYALGAIVAILSVAMILNLKKFREKDLATFVITETGKFTSLDPLDGDSSQNLPVARMLYATPIEIFSDNTLGSRVLESFSYNKEAQTIEWLVKSNVTYSDDTLITPEDIGFAVARMAYARPKFPLIKLIQGLDSWLQNKTPLNTLPDGIRIVGNKITIQLTEDYPHPLFRFALELFGIIPKSCVNLENNKITCAKIPTSGYYEMTSNAQDELLFSKRLGVAIQGKMYPEKIKILYRDSQKAFKDETLSGSETVFLSSESKFTRDEFKSIQSSFEIGFTPAAWFTILQINPHIEPFTNTKCRQVFAETFRKNFEKVSGDYSEASVFTKLVAGYKTKKELSHNLTKNNSDIACFEKFSNVEIPWGFDRANPPIFIESLKATAVELGLKLKGPTQLADRKEEVENFISNKSAFMYGRTGFWALDPTGDIQMLFTPNLHKGLQHFWKDQTLQTYLSHIVKDGQVNSKVVDEINAHIFTDAKFNVYSHIRRFYASKNKSLVQKLPIGITSPSPWHLFEAK